MMRCSRCCSGGERRPGGPTPRERHPPATPALPPPRVAVERAPADGIKAQHVARHGEADDLLAPVGRQHPRLEETGTDGIDGVERIARLVQIGTAPHPAPRLDHARKLLHVGSAQPFHQAQVMHAARHAGSMPGCSLGRHRGFSRRNVLQGKDLWSGNERTRCVQRAGRKKQTDNRKKYSPDASSPPIGPGRAAIVGGQHMKGDDTTPRAAPQGL